MDMYNNEIKQCLDKYEDKGEGHGNRYISFPLVPLLFPPQKVSNHLTNKSKETKNLNHLVYIPKIGQLYNC